MAVTRARDTEPELRLRSELHRRGLRFRVHIRPLEGVRRSVDIAFPRARVAVFVDGCFWHGCTTCRRPPKTHTDWWAEKIDRNRRRDEETNAMLHEAGWVVVRVWEHEDSSVAANAIADLLEERRSAAGGSGR